MEQLWRNYRTTNGPSYTDTSQAATDTLGGGDRMNMAWDGGSGRNSSYKDPIGVGARYAVWGTPSDILVDHVKGILADLNSTADQRAWAQQLKDQNAFYFDAAGNWYTNAQVWDARNPKPPVNRKRVTVTAQGVATQSAGNYNSHADFLMIEHASNGDSNYSGMDPVGYNAADIRGWGPNCVQSFKDSWNDPVFVPALKKTGGAIMIAGAIVLTGGMAGRTVTYEESAMVVITNVADYVSSTPPSTLGGSMATKGTEIVFSP